MKNSKKTISGIMAFAFMLSLASCGENSNSSSNSQSGGNNSAVTAEKIADKSFKAIEIGGSVPLNYIHYIKPVADTGKVLITGSTDDGSTMYVTDYEFTDFTLTNFEISTEEENSESYYNSFIGADGTIYIFATITSYGDVKMPDYDDPDFDYESFDWDAFNKAAKSTYKLYTIDIDGNILTENEIKGLEKYQSDDEEERMYVGDVYPCGDKLIMNLSRMSDSVMVTINADGTIGDEIDLGDDSYNLYTNTTGTDGNFYFSSYDDDGKSIIKHIDASTMSISDDVITINSDEIDYINNLMNGSGDYRFYVSNTTSLFGIKDDGTAEEIINWIDSDLSGDYIDFVVPDENGEFIIHEDNWTTNTDSFYRLTKRDASELENVQIISMVVNYSDSNVMEKVKEFNKTNDGYRIKIEDYNKYYEWDEEKGTQLNSPDAQLKLDIAAGKTPDIICMDNGSSLFTSLGKKGALVDLYELMGTDGTVSKDDIVPNVLKAGELDGKLLTVSPSFCVTTFIAKKKYVDKQGWTMDEMIETYNNLPKDMRLFAYNQSRESILSSLLYGGNFIDSKNGTCSFDSPEFIKLLEFCNRFEDEEGPDWETMSQDEMNDYWNEQETACMNDKAFLGDMSLYNLRDYSRARYVTFNDEISLVGLPGAGGNGATLSLNKNYAIMSSSSNKDVCWKFISQFFDEDYQTSDRVYQIPSLKSAFTKKLDEAMENPYYIDANGKKQEYENTYYINDKEVKIPNLSKEERDFLEEYILGAEPTSFDWSENIGEIVREEISAYFKGERSAQETAELIQNRVSILVSEQS
ncbi:MAG: extracellular solute-binding protein [Ruminococcus sp.]|nr:extracellular solute-binding protein [Ruminococcus sp.]